MAIKVVITLYIQNKDQFFLILLTKLEDFKASTKEF